MPTSHPHHHISRLEICTLIRFSLESLFKALRCTRGDVNRQCMLSLDHLVPVTSPTYPSDLSAFAITVRTGHLDVGEHPWKDLMTLDGDSLSSTMTAFVNVRVRVGARTVTMGTYDLARYLELAENEL